MRWFLPLNFGKAISCRLEKFSLAMVIFTCRAKFYNRLCTADCLQLLTKIGVFNALMSIAHSTTKAVIVPLRLMD